LAKKNHKNREGVVYSTNSEFEYNEQFKGLLQPDTLGETQQDLRVLLEKKGRGGKQVTVITGFVGKSDDLDALSKKLKTQCGIGGSVKDGEILLQGDVRQKAKDILIKAGYSKTKLSGG
tara:strand:+ start:52 stop:408 length:357 start_codon:yes stop_codon:yes gene_type:complete